METEFDSAHDASEVPVSAVIDTFISGGCRKPQQLAQVDDDNGLGWVTDAESLDVELQAAPLVPQGLGRGNRQRQPTKRYGDFWRHNDNEASDIEI